MKGDIKADHIPVNKYKLLIIGLPAITPTEISGMEDELESVDLPDRTSASGGNRKPTEFTMMIPAHHTVEIAACEIWFKQGQEPVSPLYKKVGILQMFSLSGQITRSRSIIGAHITKRVDPDLEMANEGEMAVIEYTVKVNDILPL